MTELKHNSSKILKKINVHSFIRDGGVVKAFTRLQEVKIPELLKKEKEINYRSIEELISHASMLHNSEFITKHNPEKFQEDILGLYCDGKHGISDPGIDSNKDRLYNIYDVYSEQNPFFSDKINTDSAYKKLTDPSYIKKLHKQNLELERMFNQYSINTERVNPFIFRTKLNLSDSKSLTEQMKHWFYHVYSSALIKHFNKNIRAWGILADYMIDGFSKIERTIKETSIPKKKLEKTIIPSILLLHLLNPKFKKPLVDPIIDIDENSNKIDKNLFDFMKSDNGLSDDLKNYNAILKDPDNDVKKPFLKFLNELEKNDTFNNFANNHNKLRMLKSKDSLIQWMKELKSDEIVPNFVYMMEHGLSLNVYKDKDFKEAFNTITSSISSDMFDAYNSRHDYVYVSNNPMDFVTMSPQASITSCQSVTQKGGDLGVNAYNANILNSLNLDKSHDFIMYTLSAKPSKKNTKENRTSVHYNTNSDEFNHYEYKKVYTANDYINPLLEYLITGNGADFWNDVNDVDIDINDDLYSEKEKYSKNNDIKNKLNTLSNSSYDFYIEKKDEAENIVNEFNKKNKHDKFNSIDDVDRHIRNTMNDFETRFGGNEDDYENYNYMIEDEVNGLTNHLRKYLTNVIENNYNNNESQLYGSEIHQGLLRMDDDADDIVDTYEQEIRESVSSFVDDIKKTKDVLSKVLNSMKTEVKKIMKK